MSEWEYVYRERFYPNDATGKWLMFFSPQHKDAWWEKVKEATEQGELGPASKISLVPRNNRYVICVYCWDLEEEKVSMRVRGRLREMGVTWKIWFKACWQSASGVKGSLFGA